MPITVLIAEHTKSKRAACLRLLEKEKGIQVVGEARSSLEAFVASARHRPDILFLDLNLAGKGGMSVLPALRWKSPETKVILLTRDAAETLILEALSFGARGYLEEESMSTFFAKAVRLVYAGEAWIPRRMIAGIVAHLVHLDGPYFTPVC
jgi:DNA-binding NarL/FixJ family response regulator